MNYVVKLNRTVSTGLARLLFTGEMCALVLTVGITAAQTVLANELTPPVTSTQSTPASIKLEGNLIQGGLAQVWLSQPATVVYKNHTLQTDSKGRLLIAFGRYDAKQQTLQIRYANGQSVEHEFSIAERQYDVQTINGLPKNKVTPDKATQEKIWQDIQKAKAARKINLPYAYFDSGYMWPVQKGIISGIYGSQRILNGYKKRPHLGIDIAAPTGTPLLAPADGQITLAENMELSGYTLMIDHGYGLRSTVMHLNKLLVTKGQLVKKGELVAEVGSTGRATGPHVHWGMSWFNERIDPGLVVYGPNLVKGYPVGSAEKSVP